MESNARAGIDLFGTALRYAEVEQYNGRYRLLRLGSCDFDFDVGRDALRTGEAHHLDTLADALRDVFEGTVATEMHVALHPPECHAFFVPFDAEAPEPVRLKRMRQEASLLLDTTETLRLTTDVLRTETLPDGQRVEWYHVLALGEPVHARFDRIFEALPFSEYRLQLSVQGVANAINFVERRTEEQAEAPFTLGVGWYGTHAEFTLCRKGQWHFGHYAEAGSPADCAYFAVAFLDRFRLRPADVGRVFLYGGQADPADFALLQNVFKTKPEPFNPMQVVDLDPNSLAANFDAESYVPCIGVAL